MYFSTKNTEISPQLWGQDLNLGEKLFEKWILQPKTLRFRYITQLFGKLGSLPPGQGLSWGEMISKMDFTTKNTKISMYHTTFWQTWNPPPPRGQDLNLEAKLFQKWLLRSKTPRFRCITQLFGKLGTYFP